MWTKTCLNGDSLANLYPGYKGLILLEEGIGKQEWLKTITIWDTNVSKRLKFKFAKVLLTSIATIQGNHPRSSSEIVATDEDRRSYPDKDLSEEQSAVGAVLFIGSHLMV